jgi:hypothetical protein
MTFAKEIENARFLKLAQSTKTRGGSLLDIRTLKIQPTFKYYNINENNTICSSASKRVTIKNFPAARLCKLTITEINNDDVCLEKKREYTGKKNDGEENVENIKRSLMRSYQTVMEKCRCIGVDRLLTLTFQENITCLKTANVVFKKFIDLMAKKFGRIQYVCVPESQKRGAIHYHLGLNSFYSWSVILACWRLAIKKNNIAGTGGIYINKTAAQGRASSMSRYIAKYILKGIKNAENSDFSIDSIFSSGDKRYYASKNIPAPVKTKIYIKTNNYDILQRNFYSELSNFLYSFLNIEFFFNVVIYEFENWHFQHSKIIEFSY